MNQEAKATNIIGFSPQLCCPNVVPNSLYLGKVELGMEEMRCVSCAPGRRGLAPCEEAVGVDVRGDQIGAEAEREIIGQ